MIRFDSVTKMYRGGARPALDQVSLEIGSGEFVFLVGASGSGKSSLLRLMLREEKPSSGEIHVLGQRLTSISSRKVPYFRRSLGVVFQDFRLLPNKTVHDNVAFTLQVIGKSRGFIQEAVPDVLRMVGLAEKSQNMPNELSGGEQQRVAIARAVVNKPAILLADEPTGNLDPATSDEIMQVLSVINASGTTVVMATHDVSIVDRMQKRVVELIGGHIVRDELEAKYVTSALPAQEAREEAVGDEQSAFVPVWARSATGPIIVPDVVDERGVKTDTGPVTVRKGTGPIPVSPQGASPLSTGSVPFVPAPQPAAARRAAATGPVQQPAPRTVQPERPAPQAAPGPVRRAPAPEQRSGATAVRPEQEPPTRPVTVWSRSSTGAVPVPPMDEPVPAAARPAAARAVPVHQQAPAAPLRDAPVAPPRWSDTPPARDPRTEADGFTGRIDLGNTGDPEGAARRSARHRDRLPDHLDFVGGLGLRDGGRDDEVGPSS